MTSFKCKVFSDSRNSLERKNLSEESYVREEGSFKSTRLNQSYKNGHSYENAYIPSFQIDQNDPKRDSVFFLANIPISIKIIEFEKEASLVLLHTSVYTIKIQHGECAWTIKRRYKNFLKLWEAYTIFKTKLNIKNAAAAHLTPNLQVILNHNTTTVHENINDNSKFTSADMMRLIFQSVASDFSHSKQILEKFLQDVVDHKIFRNHTETLKFLEVSHLSFINDLGIKNKEGVIKKRTLNIRLCSSALNFSFFWNNRWLIIKDTFVCYLDDKTGLIKSVLLVDHCFNVSSGQQTTGEKYGLFIENFSTNIFVKCYNEKRALEWGLSIMKMIQGTGSCFRYAQQFNSFAPIRNKSQVKWFVDGSDYMESIANSIETAQQEIFITGFFLSPEIYLKRPVFHGDKWRLDKLLKRKAEQGVKIYVLIYKEIEITLPINSAYSKRILTLSHENIKVLRHPDHINEPNKFLAIMWAHHEKLVVIDQSIAYFGGIDLCYGRWDNNIHKLTDLGSVLSSNDKHRSMKTEKSKLTNSEINSGIDKSTEYFSNSKNLNNIKNSVQCLILNDENNNNLSYDSKQIETHKINIKTSKPISTKLVNELGNHKQNKFLLRNFLIDNMTDYYNHFIKKDINISDQDFCQNEHSTSNPVTTESNEIDKKEGRLDRIFKGNLKRSKSLELNKPLFRKDTSQSKECNFPLKESLNYKRKTDHQSLRFFQREYKEITIFNKLKKIKQFKESLRYALKKYQDNDSSYDDQYNVYERENLDFDEEELDSQHSGNLESSAKLWIGKDYCNFIFKDVVKVHSPFQDSINREQTPRMPWHDIGGCVAGPAARDIARHFIQRWNYVKIKKVKKDKRYVLLLPKAYEDYTIPRHIANNSSKCNVQALRSVSSWSAGTDKTESSIHAAMCHLIKTSKNYIYIENQFFISLIGEKSLVRNEIAQCLYDRIVRAHIDQDNFKVYIVMPLIPGYAGEYGKSSGILLHTITHYNNVSINGLIKKLNDIGIDALNYIFFFGLRTWDELNNNIITEIIYVHSKLMIVDDRACIIGSANINDRSLLGYRDSEVALLIEDTQYVNGFLNKIPCKVGKFTSTLRKRLFREFLGEFETSSQTSFETENDLLSSEDNLIINLPHIKSKTHNNNTNNLLPLSLVDPCSDEFYKQILLKYAAQNTKLYDLVFKVIPCDYVSNFEQLKEYQKTKCLNQTDALKAKAEISKVRGFLVIYPSQFLSKQDLTPPLGTKENLLPKSLWT